MLTLPYISLHYITLCYDLLSCIDPVCIQRRLDEKDARDRKKKEDNVRIIASVSASGLIVVITIIAFIVNTRNEKSVTYLIVIIFSFVLTYKVQGHTHLVLPHSVCTIPNISCNICIQHLLMMYSIRILILTSLDGNFPYNTLILTFLLSICGLSVGFNKQQLFVMQ